MNDQDQRPPVYYSEYLQLDKILSAQQPHSALNNRRADDEMLFIVIHQAYELWFKQILHELSIIRTVFNQENIQNSSPDIYNSVHRLKRVASILDLAVIQMSVLETMTPLDFLDFRELLRPASGFQSVQFKIIEATLGLTYDARHGKGYYLSQLTPVDVERIKEAESQHSLLTLINTWLERMPFIKDDSYWQQSDPAHTFWKTYRDAYAGTLLEGERENLHAFDALFLEAELYPASRRFSAEANRSALFIMLYRDYPLLHLPYELLATLLEIDQMLSLWRHRHIHLVQRTIGKRVGTGGSSGADYLQKAADTHAIFKELAELTSFLLPRAHLPKLPDKLVSNLSFC